MSQRFLPAALKPVLVGFVIGFAMVGLTRMADAGEARPDKVVHLAASAPKTPAGNWIALR